VDVVHRLPDLGLIRVPRGGLTPQGRNSNQVSKLHGSASTSIHIAQNEALGNAYRSKCLLLMMLVRCP
jgi:hypothetical protein